MKTNFILKLAAPLALAFLAGCAQPAAYAPRVGDATTGYTDKELTPDRYRVTFTGNSVTPRETVENYLLLRAAEVTLAAGYDHFVFDTRDTRAQTHVDAVPDPDIGFYGRGFYGRGYGARGFAGGFHGAGWRFHPHFGYDPFGPPVDVFVSTSYQAYAEIVMLKPDDLAKEPRAVDAHAVIQHLGPTAQTPAQAATAVTPVT